MGREQFTPTKSGAERQQFREIQVRNGRHSEPRRAEERRKGEMLHTLAGHIARSSLPHHRPALIRNIWSAYSMLSTPRSPAAWGWGCRFAAPSSMPMGGQLWAVANEPSGAVFQFTVPRAQKALMNSPQAAHQTEEPRGEPVLNGFH
jgi:hypothetical protein